jgi:hypothetical protein
METKNLFNWQDYLELNKDLHNLSSEEEANRHWNDIGYKQMRLCNKIQLDIMNEFSSELVLYTTYYYYLYKNNLLFDNKITSYKGMKPFYYFLNNDMLIEKEEQRRWISPLVNPLMINYNEHVKYFNKAYWMPPPYMFIYKNDIVTFDKPILVIHNKYNIEWGIKPINFIDIDTLRYIFNKLKDTYQIVYIRPTNEKSDKNYSYDHNTIIDEFPDYTLIESEFKDKVVTFYDLLKRYNYIYNELLLMLYSNCENFISSQGGSSHLISFFYKKLIVLHIQGDEYEKGVYDGWYKQTKTDENDEFLNENTELAICKNYDELKENITIFNNTFNYTREHFKS